MVIDSVVFGASLKSFFKGFITAIILIVVLILLFKFKVIPLPSSFSFCIP